MLHTCACLRALIAMSRACFTEPVVYNNADCKVGLHESCLPPWFSKMVSTVSER